MLIMTELRWDDLLNGEQVRIWEKTVMMYVIVLQWHSPGNRVKGRRALIRITGNLARDSSRVFPEHKSEAVPLHQTVTFPCFAYRFEHTRLRLSARIGVNNLTFELPIFKRNYSKQITFLS
jgi:hypothetical protein